MHVLVVTSIYPNARRPNSGLFVRAQMDSLRDFGVTYDLIHVDGRSSVLNYVRAIPSVRRAAGSGKYDLLHAHYGLAGFVAVQQSRLPVVVSFCGSDLLGAPDARGRPTLNGRLQGALSRHAARRAARVIVKSDELGAALQGASAFDVVPNGVDTELFRPMAPAAARGTLQLAPGPRRVLFVGRVDAAVTRYALARAAVDRLALTVPDVELLTLSGRSQADVAAAMNASDCLVLTSVHEGSPNVVKEAMACNLPVVSTRVGDVETMFRGQDGYYLAEPDAADIAAKLASALTHGRTLARDRIVETLSLGTVARRVMEIYGAASASSGAARSRLRSTS